MKRQPETFEQFVIKLAAVAKRIELHRRALRRAEYEFEEMRHQYDLHKQ